MRGIVSIMSPWDIVSPAALSSLAVIAILLTYLVRVTLVRHEH